jgi:phosphoglycolate phosphatase-like HAD superfamily hydrolase
MQFGTEAAPVAPPAGLAPFLHGIRADARLVLATNAPSHGVEAVLERWGVADQFDALHFAIGKPDGLIPIVRESLQHGPVLAIGDIAEFDLVPAARYGADTALVGSNALLSAASVTMRAQTLADLYDRISLWVESARTPELPSSTNAHPIERHN